MTELILGFGVGSLGIGLILISASLEKVANAIRDHKHH